VAVRAVAAEDQVVNLGEAARGSVARFCERNGKGDMIVKLTERGTIGCGLA
jgi:hypothetical protein